MRRRLNSTQYRETDNDYLPDDFAIIEEEFAKVSIESIEEAPSATPTGDIHTLFTFREENSTIGAPLQSFLLDIESVKFAGICKDSEFTRNLQLRVSAAREPSELVRTALRDMNDTLEEWKRCIVPTPYDDGEVEVNLDDSMDEDDILEDKIVFPTEYGETLKCVSCDAKYIYFQTQNKMIRHEDAVKELRTLPEGTDMLTHLERQFSQVLFSANYQCTCGALNADIYWPKKDVIVSCF